MTFVLNSYKALDSSIELHFVSPDQPGGEPSDYFVTIKDEDLTGDQKTDSQTIAALVERKFKAPTLSPKLLAFAGWSIEI